jgi:hypothetical protein
MKAHYALEFKFRNHLHHWDLFMSLAFNEHKQDEKICLLHDLWEI